MKTQTAIGSSLILVACVMLLYNVSDTIADLQNWHGLTTPAVIGAILKQAASTALAALGGTLMPGIGKNASNVESTIVEVTKTIPPVVTP